MVLGILSIPACCCVFAGTPFSVAGLVCGLVGLQKIRQAPQAWSGAGIAIAGIVCSAVGLLLFLLAVLTPWDDAIRSRMGYQL